jgi:hypothetical protein
VRGSILNSHGNQTAWRFQTDGMVAAYFDNPTGTRFLVIARGCPASHSELSRNTDQHCMPKRYRRGWGKAELL